MSGSLYIGCDVSLRSQLPLRWTLRHFRPQPGQRLSAPKRWQVSHQ